MRNSTWLDAGAVLLMAASGAFSQQVRVFSEFTRIGPKGERIAADGGGPVREILSPAIARNAYASFHVALDLPAGCGEFSLHLGLNPERAVETTLYREIHDARGIPDRLERVANPYDGRCGKVARTEVFWMDLWVDAEAPLRRIKVQPQFWVNDTWIVYPMEVRVIAARVPSHQRPQAKLPSVLAPSNAVVTGPLASLVCGIAEEPAKAADPSVRSLIRRNVLQDVALARERASRHPKLFDEITAPAGAPDASAYCTAVTISAPGNLPGEWYLKVRDLLYRSAE